MFVQGQEGEMMRQPWHGFCSKGIPCGHCIQPHVAVVHGGEFCSVAAP